MKRTNAGERSQTGRPFSIITAALLFLILGTVSDSAHSEFSIRRQTFSAGKTEASSPSFSAAGVAGEAVTGMGESENFTATTQFIPEFTSCCVGQTGNIDNDPAGGIDIGDVTALIDYLFISQAEATPECMEAANVDGDSDGMVDIGDLTRLIAYMFIAPYTPPADC